MDDRAKPAPPRSYLLPVEDTEFLLRDEMRAIRFALEYAKADLSLRDWRVRSTIIVFGGARWLSPEEVEALPESLRTERVQRHLRWYEAARSFARIASERGGALTPEDDGWRDNVIATGGGPGLMEAANRGAQDAGAPSIGFNIRLPEEQVPNPFITPNLNFQFHYFAMRKMHLAMRANALVVFPGGFGTLDELFELLTLQQTRKAPIAPIALYDEAYWRRLINFDFLVEEGAIAHEDMNLISFVNSPEETWEALTRRGLTAHLRHNLEPPPVTGL